MMPVQLNMFEPPPDFPDPAPALTDCPLVIDGLTVRPTVLLDLNFTLVGDSLLKRRQGGSYLSKILKEHYRTWLVELLRPYRVILWTVRFKTYQETTLARIQELTDWQPDHWFFNPTDSYEAHLVKERYLLDLVIPQFGRPADTAYLALESNQLTRAMLKRYGIPAVKIDTMSHWRNLPGSDFPPYVR
ncbi:MAG: hypothetical protein HY866_18835 [Chloroflexi bacterium]|nr:hypothetical protein [Chloroflexota bacterium]